MPLVSSVLLGIIQALLANRGIEGEEAHHLPVLARSESSYIRKFVIFAKTTICLSPTSMTQVAKYASFHPSQYWLR